MDPVPSDPLPRGLQEGHRVTGIPDEPTYQIETLTLGDPYITINFADPSDVELPRQALFQQLVFNPMVAPDGVEELLVDIQESIGQIIDLLGVARRSPPARISTGGIR